MNSHAGGWSLWRPKAEKSIIEYFLIIFLQIVVNKVKNHYSGW